MPSNPNDENLSLAQARIQQLRLSPIEGNFDVAHLLEINKFIFQDYPELEAGKFREELPPRQDWAKGRLFRSIPDAKSMVVYSPMNDQSKEELNNVLSEIDPSSLSKLNQKEFTNAFSKLYAQLDYLHPFKDGNSRTLREFTRQLSLEAGYEVDWDQFKTEADRDRLYIARNLEVNKISLPHIWNVNIRNEAETTHNDLQSKGYASLRTLLEPIISPTSKEIEASPTISTSQPTQRNKRKQDRYAEEFAEKVIEQLEAGTAPWIKPWKAGELEAPYNATTGKAYRGMNTLRLMLEGRSDPRWITYKQAQQMGAQVRKGEKSTALKYLVTTTERIKRDENGKVIKDPNGEVVKERVKLEHPYPKYFSVFNGEQIDGLPELERPIPDPDKAFKANSQGEAILKASGAEIEHKSSARAFYSPKEDKIILPQKEQFHSESGYYATALHELGHWTGHKSRLNRDINNPFGSMAYAKEELRAEIGSMMLAMELGTGFEPTTELKNGQTADNHLAYIQSWVSALKNDPEEIIKASRDAAKIKDFVMAFEKENEIEQTQETSINKTSNSLPLDINKDQLVDAILKEKSEREGTNLHLEEVFGEWQLREEKAGSHPAILSITKSILSAPTKEGLQDKIIASYPSKSPPSETTKEAKLLDKPVYLHVPYKERKEAKEAGAQWSTKEKSWFIPKGHSAEGFEKWLNPTKENALKSSKKEPEALTYLHVPYKERKEAKKAGAQWSAKEKSWFIPKGHSSEGFEKWLNPQEKKPAPIIENIEDAFYDALREQGLKAITPIRDGEMHSIATEKNKGSEKSGYYVIHENDGHPLAYIGNHQTGTAQSYPLSGVQTKMSASEIEAQKLLMAQRQKDREEKRLQEQEKTAKEVSSHFKSLKEIQSPTPYMQNKGISLSSANGLKTDQHGNTIVPMMDILGKQWNQQTIYTDGSKRFAKDGRKEGTFFPLSGLDSLKAAPAIIIAEGLATGASIHEAETGGSVVVAFDSGQLLSVAKAIHKAYPEQPMLIAADDDRHCLMTNGHNVGKEKAFAAAKEVGARVVMPVFLEEDKHWPDNIPKFTKEEWRKNSLTEAQKEAHNAYKKLTDFNDLAQKTRLGKTILKNQFRGELAVIAKNKEKIKEQQRTKILEQSKAQARTSREQLQERSRSKPSRSNEHGMER